MGRMVALGVVAGLILMALLVATIVKLGTDSPGSKWTTAVFVIPYTSSVKN